MAIIHFFLIHKLLVKSVIRDIAFLIKLPHQNHAWPLADSIISIIHECTLYSIIQQCNIVNQIVQ